MWFWCCDQRNTHVPCWSVSFPTHWAKVRVVRLVAAEWLCYYQMDCCHTCECTAAYAGPPMWSFWYCGPQNMVVLRECDAAPNQQVVHRFQPWSHRLPSLTRQLQRTGCFFAPEGWESWRQYDPQATFDSDVVVVQSACLPRHGCAVRSDPYGLKADSMSWSSCYGRRNKFVPGCLHAFPIPPEVFPGYLRMS